jgi:adiponectin receptor
LFSDYTYIGDYARIRPWAVGGAVFIFGAITYMFRIPERFWPRKFDVIGNSHSIFHVCVIVGGYIHACESYNLYLLRHGKVCPIESNGIF